MKNIRRINIQIIIETIASLELVSSLPLVGAGISTITLTLITISSKVTTAAVVFT